MATTKIWKTRGWLGKALIYIENPEKTANPMVVGNPNMSKEQYQSLADVIEYLCPKGFVFCTMYTVPG